MRRICTLALAGAGALALPAGASAAIVGLDRPCYVSGQPGNVVLAGFAPNAVVTISNAELGSTKVTTDATGSFTLGFAPPSGADLRRPGSREFVVTATEDANPANTAAAVSRVAPFAFATDKGTKSPKSKRSWYFSGFAVGQPVYGHFRFKGRTRGNYRFGVASGPCGELKRRAPGIAVRGGVSAGLWTIQVDQSRRYSVNTKPFLKDKTVVFTRFRPRQAAGASVVTAAALSGFYRFGGFRAGI